MMLSTGNGLVDQMGDQPFRVVVEVVTPEVVARLETENAALRQEVAQLRQQHNSLHATVYQLMDRLVHLNRSVKDKG